MTTPKLSILLPTNVLNPWLDEAVDSVLRQTGVAFELIVIHDGIETDLGRPWVHDPRVTCVVNETSHGLAHALNVGARSAHGEYLARLDGDDLCLDGRLTAQVRLLDDSPEIAVAGTLARRIDETGKVTGTLGVRRDGDVRPLMLTRNCLIHSSTMFRRELFEQLGGYDSALRQMEDYELWLRMARHGDVVVIQQELVAYRVHSRQMSRGAGPTGAHIHGVLEGRVRLAAALGYPRVPQLGRNILWWGAQAMRHRGWRQSGYLRG
ncbi:glycosyltransferase [Janibacter indicus]|uniref:Glycosyltransferase 2-like domain-containing protein n=1 Tax=Janibacter indicus TaxID=857417 RepID=A0A1W1Y543_9MICO|nr:glycosyltransferase [Janibacter indicus]SMC31275.1 hypothetical protein SAMN06296429_10139 [Janibacter indicus]